VLARTDFMVVIKGVNVYPSAVENLIGEVDALTNHYELHITQQDNMDRMLVRVEAARDVGEVRFAELSDNLLAVIRERLGVTLQTEIIPHGTLERFELKTRRIFDHRTSRV